MTVPDNPASLGRTCPRCGCWIIPGTVHVPAGTPSMRGGYGFCIQENDEPESDKL